MKVSKTGYKKHSKVKNEKSLVVPSGWITMTENDGKPLEKGPILGIDNLGNMTRMEPGSDYLFPGDYVYEIPIGKAKNGGYMLPGRYRNPEGNWLNKYASGGDISIPDLSRPNWLDKAQKGQQVKYTTDPIKIQNYNDSLIVHNAYKNDKNILNSFNTFDEAMEFITNRVTKHPEILRSLIRLQSRPEGYESIGRSYTKELPVKGGSSAIVVGEYAKPKQPYKKYDPKDMFVKTPKLEREPTQLIIPQSNITLTPYNNTRQVLRGIQNEDTSNKNLYPTRVVPAPTFRHGGWLYKYQDAGQVPANLPWINQSGQYKDPTGVGPTVAKANELKQKKFIERVKNSPSLNLPSGAITPTMGPVEYALMAPVAATSIMKAAPIISSAMNAPIAGLSGVTAGNALGAGFAADAAVNRLPQIPGQLSRGEYMDAAVNAATGLLDVGSAGMLSPLYRGASKAIKSTYNPISDEDAIRGLLKAGNDREVSKVLNKKALPVTTSEQPFSKTYPTLSKRDQLDLDSFTRNKWSNPGLFWKRYNMREHGVDYDRPIPIFNDPSMPTDFMSTAAAKGNMAGKNQVLTQQSRLLNPEVKAKFFEHQAPAVEVMPGAFQKTPKDYGNRITPENYEDFVRNIHGSTDYDLASSVDKKPTNLGIGNYGKPGMVFKDAPLSNLGKDVINAHEKNHGIFAGTISREMEEALLKPFGTNKPIPHYASKHQADEVLARMAQFKNAAGIGDNQVFTLGHLNLIRKNYANQFVDNGITAMLSKIKPGSEGEKEFLRNMNKYAFGIGALTTAGTAALQKEKDGGWLNKYQDGSQVPQSWKDKYDWTPNVEEEYQIFKNDPNAPENLRFTDDIKDYNTRGMWDSLDRPSNWQQALDLFKQQQGYEWTPEDDGYYHAWSQHPGTGEWLKPKHHSTGWMNYMGYAFDPNTTAVVNPEGFFGNETLQAYPRKKNGGVKSSGEGYYDYINGYSGIFANGGRKGWLDNYK